MLGMLLRMHADYDENRYQRWIQGPIMYGDFSIYHVFVYRACSPAITIDQSRS